MLIKVKKFQFVEDICKNALKLRTSKEFLQINKRKRSRERKQKSRIAISQTRKPMKLRSVTLRVLECAQSDIFITNDCMHWYNIFGILKVALKYTLL